MAGWGGRTRPPGWTKTRDRILTRDQHKCYLCGDPANEVDHVVNIAAGGTHNDGNLAAICRPCHAAKTKREATAGKPTRRRQTEAHPGRRTEGRGGYPEGQPPANRGI